MLRERCSGFQYSLWLHQYDSVELFAEKSMRAGPCARRIFDLGCDFDTSEEVESAPLLYIEAQSQTIYMCNRTSISTVM